MYQGNLSNLTYQSIKLAYLINPQTNLKVEFEIILRNLRDEEQELKTQMVTVGVKSDLFNNYYDF